jgi:hypothetical protein
LKDYVIFYYRRGAEKDEASINRTAQPPAIQERELWFKFNEADPRSRTMVCIGLTTGSIIVESPRVGHDGHKAHYRTRCKLPSGKVVAEYRSASRPVKHGEYTEIRCLSSAIIVWVAGLMTVETEAL